MNITCYYCVSLGGYTCMPCATAWSSKQQMTVSGSEVSIKKLVKCFEIICTLPKCQCRPAHLLLSCFTAVLV